MTTFSLPAGMTPSAVSPRVQDFGRALQPLSGGPTMRYNRIGMRLGGLFTMPPMEAQEDGRLLVSRLVQAKSVGLLIDWPLMGFDPGSTGTPRVKTAVSGGQSLQIKGLPAGYQAKEGQFLTLISAATGVHYLHMFTADGTANGSGDLTASVWPTMRRAFAINDVILLAQPKIEGLLVDDQMTWDYTIDKTVEGVQFTLLESA